MNRRGFLNGILAAGAAPWVCTKAGVLMPPRHVIQPIMTATEVLARQREYLARVINIELLINPPVLVDNFGLVRQMAISEAPFFKLEPVTLARAHVFGGSHD